MAGVCDLIAFRVGGQDFCVDARHVKEIRGWSPVTLLPDSPPYLRGVINLRGTVLPIVDLALRLELQAADVAARPAVMVVWVGRKLVGLLVDAVCDILSVDACAIHPTPETGCGILSMLVPSIVATGDGVAGLLALERLLPEMEAAA